MTMPTTTRTNPSTSHKHERLQIVVEEDGAGVVVQAGAMVVGRGADVEPGLGVGSDVAPVSVVGPVSTVAGVGVGVPVSALGVRPGVSVLNGVVVPVTVPGVGVAVWVVESVGSTGVGVKVGVCTGVLVDPGGGSVGGSVGGVVGWPDGVIVGMVWFRRAACTAGSAPSANRRMMSTPARAKNKIRQSASFRSIVTPPLPGPRAASL